MSTGEAILMMAIGFVIALPVLLLLVVSNHRGGGTQPIGKVGDAPPRPTPPPPIRASSGQQPTGLIPGRPGQEVNSGGDTFIPPLRPSSPRPEDRAYTRPEANPRLKDRG